MQVQRNYLHSVPVPKFVFPLLSSIELLCSPSSPNQDGCEAMDLEVVGRHALLFDDDANAAFVNSSKALVEWYSLLIDRYDVRHLLPGPLPPRLKRRPVHQLDAAAAASLEADLDYERFLDLPSSPSDEHEQEQEQGNASGQINSGGYLTVAFSYGNPEESAKTKDHDSQSGFHPDFPVPESLCQNLPPNEKVHQIIARTALFVSKNGGQSEIILRVKQGDNPTFGFLMPDHHLYPYFRFLVDHQEILKPGVDKNRGQDTDQTGGALSLLGSAYGSGEDDDGATENTTESKINESEETVEAISTSASQGLWQAESSPDATKKDGGISKDPISPLKEKVPVIKRNHLISSVKTTSTGMTKKSDSVNSLSNVPDKLQTSLPSTTKIELPILEPTSEMKRVIEKIVEFILKNGRQFEAVLAEQDRAHGRFPFLLSSNPYHPYYLKVLQNAQESKLHGKGFLLEKHDSVGRLGDKKSTAHNDKDNHLFGYVGSDIPYDTDRKEKFKMVIGKSKKDGQEPTSKDNQPQAGVSMDVAAAAAILQAATRGIRNPSLEIFAKTSSGNGEGPSSDGGGLSSLSLHSSQPQQSTEASVSVPVAKIIAQTAAIAAAGEADSSEASMSREQKLKAERLKQAKMFAAMIKGGAAPLKSEPLRGLSVEPPGSGVSGSGAETGNLAGKDREGSSVPFDADNSDKRQKSEEKPSFNDEWRSKRSYQSRSRRHEAEQEEEEKEKGEGKSDHKHPRKKHRSHRSRSERREEEEEEEKDRRDHKHSRKKHRSHRSLHSSPDRHKHKKRHSSSKDEHSTKRKRHDSSSDDEHQHSRHRHEYDSSSDEKHYSFRHGHRDSSLSENERRHSRRRHKHYSSSDDEHRRQRRGSKHKSRPFSERETDLEGEKSDQSKASKGVGASREASVELSKSNDNVRAPSSQPSETTEVSDELRAKIRAILMATL